MKNLQTILMIFLWTVSSTVSAEKQFSSSNFPGPIILNEEAMDSITAGAVTSLTNVQALARGPNFADTNTDVRTYARDGYVQVVPDSQALQERENLPFVNDFTPPANANGATPTPILALTEWRARLAETPGFDKFGWDPVTFDFNSYKDNAFVVSGTGPVISDINSYNDNFFIVLVKGPETGGEGNSIARSDEFAMTNGSSTSFINSIGVSVSGEAKAFGEQANASTQVSTRVIDAGRVRIVIGQVSSVACCGSGSDTSAHVATFGANDSNFGLVALAQVNQTNTDQISSSFGSAIVITMLPP